jgi:metallo-beta-lactamase family protein
MLEVNGLRVLLDCGMFQGPREQANQFNRWLADGATQADAVILSHGHLDHCGKLPVLVRAGYRGPIYCTPATFDVARIVLEDAGEIQEEDAAYLNRRARKPGEPPVQPLFTRSDVHDVLKLMQRVKYGEKTAVHSKGRTDLPAGLSFTFFDAGHILGSAYVHAEYSESNQSRTLLFTGDIGRYNTPIIRDPAPPPGPVDLVITESTYGTKTHAPMAEVEPQFLDAVKTVIARKGRLLIPAFAVGRTQVVLHFIQRSIHAKQIPPIPIYVDSPMGVEVSQAHQHHRESYDAETAELIGKADLFALSYVTFASSGQQSRQINQDPGPCVIIASSPTCEFGRILHHLKQSVERPQDMVVFAGWVPPGTLGRKLQDRAPRVRIYDRWYDVKCEIRTIHGLSAHADGNELIRFLKPALAPQTRAYVVHGEPDQAEGFARRLMNEGAAGAAVPAEQSSVITSADAGSAPMPAADQSGKDAASDGD